MPLSAHTSTTFLSSLDRESNHLTLARSLAVRKLSSSSSFSPSARACSVSDSTRLRRFGISTVSSPSNWSPTGRPSNFPDGQINLKQFIEQVNQLTLRRSSSSNCSARATASQVNQRNCSKTLHGNCLDADHRSMAAFTNSGHSISQKYVGLTGR